MARPHCDTPLVFLIVLLTFKKKNPMRKNLKARKFQVQKIKPFCIKNIVPKKKKKKRETSIIGIYYFLIFILD
jgi:hypothetical protein